MKNFINMKNGKMRS